MSTQWADLPSRRRARIRAEVFALQGRRCSLQLPGCTERATEVDHVTPSSQGGAHALDNLAPVCRSCNAARRDQSTGGDGRFGARVVVVVGPPGAGKTWHVRTNVEPDDVVIDFDALAHALAPAGAPATEHVREVAAAARHAALSAARWLPVDCTVWLIHAMPSTSALTRYRRDGWQIQVVDPGEQTVRDRLAERGNLAPELDGAARWYGSPAHRAVSPSREW